MQRKDILPQSLDAYQIELKEMQTIPEYKLLLPIQREQWQRTPLTEENYPILQKIYPYFIEKMGQFISPLEIKYYAHQWVFLFSNEKLIKYYCDRSLSADLSKQKIQTVLDFILPKGDLDKQLTLEIFKKESIKNDFSLMKKLVSVLDKLLSQIKQDADKRNIKIKQLMTEINHAYFLNFLAKVRYSKMTADTLFDAQVFSRYNVEEKYFDMWLELKSKAVNSDSVLPPAAVFFDGSSIGQPNRLIVKMSFDDPRLPILGHITDCCERIDEESSESKEPIGRQHVYEDVQLPTIGIAAIVAKDVSFPEMKQRYLLSRQCKDEHIIGFIRLVQAQNQELLIDTMIMRFGYRSSRSIAIMIAKFADSFLEKSPEYNAVWLGAGFGNEYLELNRFFLRAATQAHHALLPVKMKHSSSLRQFLISNREQILYTKLIYQPDCILDIHDAKELKEYPQEHIFNLLLRFGSRKHFDHLLNLLKNRLSVNPFKLACEIGNFEIVAYLIKFEPRFFEIDSLPNLLTDLAESQLESKSGADSVTKLLADLSDKTVKTMLLAQLSDGTNLLHYLLQYKKLPLLKTMISWIFKTELLDKQQRFTLFFNSNTSQQDVINLINNYPEIFLELLDESTPDEIEALLLPKNNENKPLDDNLPLIACKSFSTFKLIVEHKNINQNLKQRIILAESNYMHLTGKQIKSSVLVKSSGSTPLHFNYLFHGPGSNILTTEQKIELLHRRYHLLSPGEQNVNILHSYSDWETFNICSNLKRLQEIFALDAKIYQPHKLLWQKNTIDQTPLEVALTKNQMEEAAFFLEQMCHNKEEFLLFIEQFGQRISHSLRNNKDTLKKWILLVNTTSQKHQLRCSHEEYIPKDIFSVKPIADPIYQELFVIPNLPIIEEKYAENHILILVRNTLLEINQFPNHHPHKNIVFNLFVGLFIELAHSPCNDLKGLAATLQKFEENHGDFLKHFTQGGCGGLLFLRERSIYPVMFKLLKTVNEREKVFNARTR
jgi:hypothetical protein